MKRLGLFVAMCLVLTGCGSGKEADDISVAEMAKVDESLSARDVVEKMKETVGKCDGAKMEITGVSDGKEAKLSGTFCKADGNRRGVFEGEYDDISGKVYISLEDTDYMKALELGDLSELLSYGSTPAPSGTPEEDKTKFSVYISLDDKNYGLCASLSEDDINKVLSSDTSWQDTLDKAVDTMTVSYDETSYVLHYEPSAQAGSTEQPTLDGGVDGNGNLITSEPMSYTNKSQYEGNDSWGSNSQVQDGMDSWGSSSGNGVDVNDFTGTMDIYVGADFLPSRVELSNLGDDKDTATVKFSQWGSVTQEDTAVPDEVKNNAGNFISLFSDLMAQEQAKANAESSGLSEDWDANSSSN